MYTHKKIILASFLMMLICGFLSIMLEWEILKIPYKINILTEHRDFIINLMLGIFASCLLAFLVAFFTYREIWINSISEYYSIAMDIDFQNILLTQKIINNMSDGKLNMSFCISDELFNEIRDIGHNLIKLNSIVKKISIIRIPILNRIIFSKKQKLASSIIRHYKKTTEYDTVIYKVKQLIRYLKVNKDEQIEDMLVYFHNTFQEILDFLNKGDNDLNSLYRDLQHKYCLYFNIEE